MKSCVLVSLFIVSNFISISTKNLLNSGEGSKSKQFGAQFAFQAGVQAKTGRKPFAAPLPV